MDYINNDIILYIINYLNPSEVINFSCTCKYLNNVLKLPESENINDIIYMKNWRELLSKDYLNLLSIMRYIQNNYNIWYSHYYFINLAIKEKSKNKLLTNISYQQKEISLLKFSKPSWCVIQAFAGTGKTTTLYHYCKNNSTKKILYLAFNKSLEEEAKNGKLGSLSNVDCYTFHSYTKEQLDIPSEQIINDYSIMKLKKLFPYLGYVHIEQLRNKLHQFFYSDSRKCSKDVSQLWKMINKNEIKYTHDGYLKKFQLEKKIIPYDIILLDEAQDSTSCMLDILKNQTHATKILIGDSFQQIYKFRGSLDPFELYEGKKYNLSYTFRFGTEICEMTNMFLKDFKLFNSNLETYSIYDSKIYLKNDNSWKYKEGTKCHLFNTNLCLYNFAFYYARQCININIIGNDKKLLKEAQIAQDLTFIDRREYHRVQHKHLKSFKTIQEVENFYISIGEFKWIHRITMYNEYGHELKEQYELLNDYISSEDPVIHLSTIHKSKGLEFDHVKLADDFPFFMLDDKIITRNTAKWKERYNLIYVAITRPKKTLTLNTQLQDWYLHKIKRKWYSSSTKMNTCRKCGILTNLLESDVYMCRDCSTWKEYLKKEI